MSVVSANQEVEIGRIEVPAWAKKQVSWIQSQPIAGVVIHSCHLVSQEAKIGGLQSWPARANNQNNQSKTG
jgi:hypothetical protein